MMHKYTFKDGTTYTTKLEINEFMKRLNRLDTLRVLTENHEEGTGRRICNKAWKAFNKKDDFTGIIRLDINEKDFLGYKLEDGMLDEEDIEVIRFYANW